MCLIVSVLCLSNQSSFWISVMTMKILTEVIKVTEWNNQFTGSNKPESAHPIRRKCGPNLDRCSNFFQEEI